MGALPLPGPPNQHRVQRAGTLTSAQPSTPVPEPAGQEPVLAVLTVLSTYPAAPKAGLLGKGGTDPSSKFCSIPSSARKVTPMKLVRRALTATAALVLLATSASPATAITGGEPDGNAHPNVALIFTYSDSGALQRCSATLISPAVLLTAAHCVSGTVGESFVTFESVIGDAPPVAIPRATNPDVGYTDADLAAVGALSGTATVHPDYSNAFPVTDRTDVAVIVLDTAVTGIVPAELAPVGYLDEYQAPLLNKTIFEVVGYGTEVRKPAAGPQKPEPMNFPLLRRTTTSPGQKLDTQTLQLHGNPNDPRGGGGTCSGDSGGPVFLNGHLVAVSSYGFNTICRYIDGYQRTDTARIQDWLTPTSN
jgi:hypothetical protein